MNKQGKVLLVTGTSLRNQYDFVENFCQNNVDFIPLNTIKLFNNVVKEITREYFSEDIKRANELINIKHDNFLELLFYLQKINDPSITDFYKEYYKKIQLINKIILYRIYESFFLHSKQITSSGKHCILTENIFIDPYPLRKDIFYSFFDMYGENFKIVNIYTDIETSIIQLIESSNNFIKYVFSKKTGYSAYKKNIKLEETYGYPVNRYEDPLFTLELFPLLYNISNKEPKNSYSLQEITGTRLKDIYSKAINQNKKLFGLSILKQYPHFYYKYSIINEVGKKFLFIKNFKKNEMVYFTSNKVDSHYNIIQSNHLINGSNFVIPRDFILSIESWIKQDNYLPYKDVFLQNSLLKYNNYNINNPKAICKLSKLSQKGKTYVQDLSLEYQVIFIENLYNIKKTNKILNNLINLNNLCIFLKTNNNVWLSYIIILFPNTQIKIKYYCQSNNKINCLDEHLILVNYIYIRISKQLNTHFFIDFIDLTTEIKLDKKDLSIKKYLDLSLSYLNKNFYGYGEEFSNE